MARMDFPLPIRSCTSTMPLYVDTNIVYQIDETKFMGLQESSHASEPALIVDYKTTWNSKNTCDEMIRSSSITTEEENQDLYNLIESLDVEDTILFPVDVTVNILDLPEITSGPSTGEVSVPQISSIVFTSGVDMPAENLKISPVDHVSSNCLTVDTNYPINIIESQLSRCKEHHQMPSFRFAKPRMSAKRKRHLSSANQEDATNSIQTEVKMFSKRTKMDLNELWPFNYNIDYCLDSFIGDSFSEMPFYQETNITSLFNFCQNSDTRFV